MAAAVGGGSSSTSSSTGPSLLTVDGVPLRSLLEAAGGSAWIHHPALKPFSRRLAFVPRAALNKVLAAQSLWLLSGRLFVTGSGLRSSLAPAPAAHLAASHATGPIDSHRSPQEEGDDLAGPASIPPTEESQLIADNLLLLGLHGDTAQTTNEGEEGEEEATTEAEETSLDSVRKPTTGKTATEELLELLGVTNEADLPSPVLLKLPPIQATTDDQPLPTPLIPI